MFSDRCHYESFYDHLIPISSQLAAVISNIEIWRRIWHVAEDTPPSVYFAYWSLEGAQLILSQLSDIQLKTVKINRDFRSAYLEAAQVSEEDLLSETRPYGQDHIQRLQLNLDRYSAQIGWRHKLTRLVKNPLFRSIKVDVCIEEQRDAPECSIVSIAENLHDALRKLSQADDFNKYQIRDFDEKHIFTVHRTDAPQKNTAILRCLLAFVRGLRWPNLFRQSEKLKLVYKLVECALPLLRTSWLSSLCSCAVRRTEDRDNLYAIRFGEKQHYGTRSGECMRNVWCYGDWQKMRIRRIGVLLTEIATGNNVVKAILNQETGHVRIYFDENTLERDENFNDSINVSQIAARVEEGAGRDFRDVVGYCLEGPFADDIEINDLENFSHTHSHWGILSDESTICRRTF